jgi:hypothetical protein
VLSFGSHFRCFQSSLLLYSRSPLEDVSFSQRRHVLHKRSRYVDLILFEEGLDLFSPLVELSFRSLSATTGVNGSALSVVVGDD